MTGVQTCALPISIPIDIMCSLFVPYLGIASKSGVILDLSDPVKVVDKKRPFIIPHLIQSFDENTDFDKITKIMGNLSIDNFNVSAMKDINVQLHLIHEKERAIIQEADGQGIEWKTKLSEIKKEKAVQIGRAHV